MMKIKKPLVLILSVLGCILAGSLGSIFTSSSIPTWYASLIKPSFNPPNWIFGPVWTALYIMMGIAFYLVISSKAKKNDSSIRNAAIIFSVQLVLNVLWSIMFFGFKSPLMAFANIVLLWAAILIAIIRFYRISKPAAYLMIPYILWVSFAAVLNFSIMILNG